MGTSHSAAEFAGKLRQAETDVRNAERPAVQKGAKDAEKVMLLTAAAKGAVGKRGVTIKSRQTQVNGHHAVGVRFGPNPGWVAILDSLTKPHFIGPSGKGKHSLRKQGGMKGRQRAVRMAVASMMGGPVGAGTQGAIGIPNIGPRAYAMHPGTKGKHFVAPAMTAAYPVALKAMHQTTITEYAKAFR